MEIVNFSSLSEEEVEALAFESIDLLPLSERGKEELAERLTIIVRETDEWLPSLFNPNDYCIGIFIPKRKPWSEGDRETCLGFLAHELWHAYERFMGKIYARAPEELGWQYVCLLSPNEFKALCFEARFWRHGREALQRLGEWVLENGGYLTFLRRLREAFSDGAF